MAQTVLNYETHALRAGEDNPMTICGYTDPGIQGEDITWDFTHINKVKPFKGYVRVSETSEINGSNIELEEFSSKFFFDISQDGMKQVGYMSSNGISKIIYTSPFEKIRFPFKMGDSFSGNFAGSYYYKNVEKGAINGFYEVSAESYGTLKLPGVSYLNTLRIKTTKNYTMQLANSEQEVHITTYRWYNQQHRYPLLVFTEYTTYSGGKSTTSYQAAYNSNALQMEDLSNIDFSQIDITLFPQPAIGVLNLQLEMPQEIQIDMAIYDMNGRLVRQIDRTAFISGINTMDLSEEISGLKPGNYLLVLTGKNKSISKEFNIFY